MFNNSTPFTMPVTPCNGSNNGSFFNGDGAWVIILFALIFGWGNGGWGGFGGYGAGGVQENYVLTSDFSQLSRQIADTTAMTERKLDGISNGICSLGYDQLAQMNGINSNIMAGTNTLQGAIKDCCCQTQQNIADVKYTIGSSASMLDRSIADGFCKTNFNAQTNARDIIDSQASGTRAILDKLCQMESNAKDEKIAELTAKNSDLRLAASQCAQNAYLINELRPCPQPAYVVPNPYCNCQCGQTYGTTIA